MCTATARGSDDPSETSVQSWAMRGVLSFGGYVPHYRLDRREISQFLGSGGGLGTRAAASFDEDTTTMGFEAARRCLASTPVRPAVMVFSTVTPGYVDRTNATAIHAALRLPEATAAFDANGSVRSVSGALTMALRAPIATLVVGADMRGGLPGSGDESSGGDASAAVLVGDDADGPLVAEYLGSATCTDEFVDRWRQPGELRSKLWEERFGEVKYLDAAQKAWRLALERGGVEADQVSAVVSGLHGRACKAVAGRLGAKAVLSDHSTTIGNPGSAQPLLLLCDAIERASAGEVIGLVVLSDGAEVHLFRVTDAVGSPRSHPSVAQQLDGAGAPLSYGKFLSWRRGIEIEPPRRPEPARASSSAADRNEAWKFGFVANREGDDGPVSMPPAAMSVSGRELQEVPRANVAGTIVTFTIDGLAYSQNPPIVFAVVDFDGGGRLPIELTDVLPSDVAIGGRVEMTFRRLGSSDGIHNYFWKARPTRTIVQET